MRDYGTATWEGGDAGCDHKMSDTQQHAHYVAASTLGGGKANQANGGSMRGYKDTCGKCGARRVDQQIGLEARPEDYVARLVEVFREVRRVLHPSGTLWLNLGDSYAGGGGGNYGSGLNVATHQTNPSNLSNAQRLGVKSKDLIGIPWLCAFALRADGWWLRSAITWCKGNPMPESVTDRPTSATEMVFMLAKSERYFYDAEAIAEPAQGDGRKRGGYINGPRVGQPVAAFTETGKRNKRNWWLVNSEPYPGAHYATFPTALVTPCVLAGTSAHGVCAACGSPWERQVEREGYNGAGRADATVYTGSAYKQPQSAPRGPKRDFGEATSTTLGWAATCTCQADATPAVVLDPFAGSGTVLAVALKHGRRAIGIDLDGRNEVLVRQRIEQSQPLLFSI